MATAPVVTTVVDARGVVKRYAGQSAVEGVSFSVSKGELYGLIGPDGAGKSSLLKAAAGVLTYDGGEIKVFGRRLRTERDADDSKARVGFMPQGLGLNLYPELSVEENVDFFARLRLTDRALAAARKEKLLGITRLAPFRDRAVKHLSGGMKQKLGLVCTLIHEPELLILDEPTTGVDPVSRREFWTILRELQLSQGMTAIVSTAYMEEASRFDRLALMHEGAVLAEGRPEELLARLPYVAVLVEAEPQMEAFRRLKQKLSFVEMRGARFRALVAAPCEAAAMALVREVLEGCLIRAAAVVAPELEDVFAWLLEPKGALAAERVAHSSRPPASAEPAIEAENITRDFDSFRAVDGVSFRVWPGQVFGLLGANGAGKTTVIKMLTGIIPPTSGHGQVAGADMRKLGRAIKRRIGYVSQSFSLYQDLTALENLRLYAGIYGLSGLEAKPRIDWALEMGGLAGRENEFAGRLPMGLRQRLALGCALLHSPRVLFLDEPTSGVDPLGRRRFWEVLLALARSDGVAILITTHYMTEAEQCDRLGLLFAGKLVADATPDELKREVEEEQGFLVDLAVKDAPAACQWLRESGFPDAEVHGWRVHLASPSPDTDIPRLTAAMGQSGIAVLSAAVKPLTMEDVFVYRVTALEQAAKGAA